jgi:CDP-glucose 4,6-dehydratase
MRDGAAHPAEAQLLRLDASKSRAGLDWHPVLPLDQSLLWIAEWYHDFEAGKDLQSLTRRQIERYEYLLQDCAEQNAAAQSKKGVHAPLLSTAEA